MNSDSLIGFRSNSDSILVQQRVHRHWLSLIRPDEDMPRVSSFDPLDIPFALGSITVTEVTDGPRFTIRLLATNIQSRLSCSLRGKPLECFPEPDRAPIIMDAHERCYLERNTTFFDSDVTEFGMTRTYRARLWPFMDDNKRIVRIVACRAVLPDTLRVAS